MKDEDVLMLLGLGLLALSSVKKVEAKKEEEKKEVEKYVTYTVEGVPALAGVGGAVAPEELAEKIQEFPDVRQAIENIAIQPIENMLITSPDQPIQIQPQPVKPPEAITIQPIEAITTQVMPQPVAQPQVQSVEKVSYEPECVPYVEDHKLISSGRYKPSADEIMRLFSFIYHISSSEAEAIEKYDLCYVKYCTFSFEYEGLTYSKLYLVCKPYSIIDMSHNVWLWIHTDLDCRNVLCMAFLDDAYAYPLTYYPDKDAYRYFIQIPVKVLQYDSNQVIISGSERCGEVKIVQQGYPYQMRSKKVCVNVNQNEIDITL
jgi:hypothetical protein